MVSKQLLTDYEFNNIENFFNHIIDSKINGQNSQVRNLINNLSIGQKVDAIRYMEDQISSFNNIAALDVKEIILNNIKNN